LADHVHRQSHLFLHHILLVHLSTGRIQDAVRLASQYRNLVFFAHALEVLLHTVVEADPNTTNSHASASPTSLSAFGITNGNAEPAEQAATIEYAGEDAEDELLRAVVTFLDYFDDSLDVVVRCARKTEMSRWPRLFAIAGDPAELFEVRAPATAAIYSRTEALSFRPACA
jgi:hypothetical protein